MRRSDGEKCPHCGSISGYLETVRMGGRRTYQKSWDGHSSHADTDAERERVPKSVICETCGKKVVNPTPT